MSARIKVEFARRVVKGGQTSMRQAMTSIPYAVALASTRRVRARVQGQGKTTKPFNAYANDDIRVVSPRYPVRPSSGPMRVVDTSRLSGRELLEANRANRRARTFNAKQRALGPRAFVFRSSAAMHANAVGDGRPGHFSPSGGMWGGLSAVVSGTRAARALFRGRSEGQGMALSLKKTEEPYFDRDGKPHPRRISNALKAKTVLASTGVNVLDLFETELDEVTEAGAAVMRDGVTSAMFANVEWVGVKGARTAFARAIVEAAKKRK